ncbi:MAG TPA: hypothetical protein VNC15_10230 [Solirubrobacterales bacterium]|jgi:hypothetical protein|nr:hypothetical protein [Solirubrobacterales bacterium]
MRDEALNKALRDAAIPMAPEAEERGRLVVEAAYAEHAVPERPAAEAHRPLPRLALALGIATLLAALLLSPAGAAVRDWVAEVVESSAPKPEPELARIPGGGRLLVQSAAGPWVVQPDGSRRLLGDYEEASWSPRGLFVAAAEGRTLSAVEPGGTPHWSLTAGARVRTPRWAPAGERIAYRSAEELRIVAGDGTDDRLLAVSTAPLAPAWSPVGDAGLAYVSGNGELRIVNSETGEALAAAPALADISRLEWGAGGTAILEASPRGLRLRGIWVPKISLTRKLGDARTLPLPAGSSLTGAALAPKKQAVAAVVTHWRDHGTSSEVLLFAPGAAKPRSLLTVPGSLGEVAWSPDGRRLLVAWPGANQWLFLPVGRGKPRAVANISTAFSPGERAASFPRVEGWCCR